MSACVLIITLAGEIAGCLPPEQVMTMEQPADQWERLREAVAAANGVAK